MAIRERLSIFGLTIPLLFEKKFPLNDGLKLDVIIGQEFKEAWRDGKIPKAGLTIYKDDVIRIRKKGSDYVVALIGEEINQAEIELDSSKRFWFVGRVIRWTKN